MNNKVSFGTNFSLGFKIFGKSLGWHLIFSLVVFAAFFVVAMIAGAVGSSSLQAGQFGIFISVMTLLFLLISPLLYGYGYIADSAYFGKVSFSDAFKGFKKAVPIIGISLVLTVINFLVMILFGYLTLGDLAGQIFQVYMDMMSQGMSMSDPYAQSESQMALIEIMQTAAGRIFLFYLLVYLAQTITIFPAYYLAYGNHSFGDALQHGFTSGFKNVLVNFGTFFVLGIMLVVIVMIFGLISLAFANIEVVYAILMFLLYGAIISLVFSIIQAMYRQMDPQEVNAGGDDLQDILDVE